MVSDYLKVVTYFVLSFTNIIFFHDFIFHESEMRTVLLEVSIDLGLLKKSLLKTSKIVLLYSNSLARHFSSIVHDKCLLPRLDRLLFVRSCLQNFYQCTNLFIRYLVQLIWKYWKIYLHFKQTPFKPHLSNNTLRDNFTGNTIKSMDDILTNQIMS